MKIIEKPIKEQKKLVCHAKPGDIFKYGKDYFVQVDSNGMIEHSRFISVNLTTNKLCVFAFDNTVVEFYDESELTVYK